MPRNYQCRWAWGCQLDSKSSEIQPDGILYVIIFTEQIFIDQKGNKLVLSGHEIPEAVEIDF